MVRAMVNRQVRELAGVITREVVVEVVMEVGVVLVQVIGGMVPVVAHTIIGVHHAVWAQEAVDIEVEVVVAG
jgi:uncharacterized protein (DUF697 family)